MNGRWLLRPMRAKAAARPATTLARIESGHSQEAAATIPKAHRTKAAVEARRRMSALSPGGSPEVGLCFGIPMDVEDVGEAPIEAEACGQDGEDIGRPAFVPICVHFLPPWLNPFRRPSLRGRRPGP